MLRAGFVSQRKDRFLHIYICTHPSLFPRLDVFRTSKNHRQREKKKKREEKEEEEEEKKKKKNLTSLVSRVHTTTSTCLLEPPRMHAQSRKAPTVLALWSEK